MPIVFGGAATISALVALPRAEHVSPWLWLGIVVVGAGIVLVAYNTPHAVPAGRPAESAESAQAN
jgi:drug/metabolite transporter (DMT)-like permease